MELRRAPISRRHCPRTKSLRTGFSNGSNTNEKEKPTKHSQRKPDGTN